eukprot:TRINITY_DN2421_c0_g4_i1.p1 TRINITY_DN2421_c0_g4~~TRINITY_DN2421_c0_g4_i1.p1  ORF type:complete len:286 (+),score=70.46 TRINITY_DN2421_c0_g4_i1:10-867(+)
MSCIGSSGINAEYGRVPLIRHMGCCWEKPSDPLLVIWNNVERNQGFISNPTPQQIENKVDLGPEAQINNEALLNDNPDLEEVRRDSTYRDSTLLNYHHSEETKLPISPARSPLPERSHQVGSTDTSNLNILKSGHLANYGSGNNSQELSGLRDASTYPVSSEEQVSIPKGVIEDNSNVDSDQIPQNSSVPSTTSYYDQINEDEVQCHALALWDFNGDVNNWQISFSAGDLISVVDACAEEDWWIGHAHGVKGYLPKAYVQIQKREIKVSGAVSEKIAGLQKNLAF